MDPKLRELLRKRRVELCISQTQLAKMMGTSQSAISELETEGDSSVVLTTLAKWCEALEVGLEILITVPTKYKFNGSNRPTD